MGALDVWEKTCCYLYLPRLKDNEVYRATVSAGVGSRDFFGLHTARKSGGKYTGFSFGKAAPPILDGSLLLIEPSVAAAYEDAVLVKPELPKTQMCQVSLKMGAMCPISRSHKSLFSRAAKTESFGMRRFYGAIDLDAILAKKQFADLVDEVVIPFTSRPGCKVRIAIEIQAEAEGGSGFDDGLQRTVN